MTRMLGGWGDASADRLGVPALRIRVQIHRTLLMLNTVACVYNPSAPRWKQEAEIGEPLQAHRPASLTYIAERRACFQVEGKGWHLVL